MEILIKGKFFGYVIIEVTESQLKDYEVIEVKDFVKIDENFKQVLEKKTIYKRIEPIQLQCLSLI